MGISDVGAILPKVVHIIKEPPYYLPEVRFLTDRQLVMIGLQLVMLFAGGVWAIPEPIQVDGVAFKLTRANKPVGGVNAASKRQSTDGIYTSSLGDLSDDCMPPIRASDLVYTMDIQIGSQSRDFKVMLDTQTSGIWVASSNCTTGGCVDMSTLGFSDSGTLVPNNPPFNWSIDYSMTGSVSGRASGIL
jgi:Eukaryotic aspartyl protease